MTAGLDAGTLPCGCDQTAREHGHACLTVGPQLATADDVIAGRARYADTPGGHADRRTRQQEST